MPISMDTIHARSSVRRFDGRPLEPAVVEQVEHAIADESTPGPFGNAPRFVLAKADNLSSVGRLGTYGVIRDAPSFLVGAVERSAGGLVDFAFRMEGLILRATALGLGTCWLGGTFRRVDAARLLPLRDDEVVPAVTPLGVPGNQAHLVGELFKLAARLSRRKPFEQLFFKGSLDEPLSPEGAGRWSPILESVRRAPSARNRQPWRVVLERRSAGDRLHLYLAGEHAFDPAFPSRTMHHLDMGIAMRHVAEAAHALDSDGRWQRMEAPASASAGGGVAYIATWLS